jgi:diguanylate cyclase (GGDEF)-like protein
MEDNFEGIFISKAHPSLTGTLLQGNKKALYVILTVTCILFIVLAINNYYLNQNVLAASLSFFVLITCIDSYALHKGNQLPISLNFIISQLVLSFFLAVFYLGISAISWAYPISVAIIYITPVKPATLFNIVIFVFVGAYSFLFSESPEAIRVSLSLLLTILFTGLVARHVQQLYQKLYSESILDPMTGTFNRRQLSTHLETCFAFKKRNNINSAILMFDIDNFKSVNDTYGHNIGDKVIIKLASIIDSNSRNSDLLFRIGGEEFILLLHNTNTSHAIYFAEKLRKLIEQEHFLDNSSITVSIGVCASFDVFSVEMWIKSADEALYVAKRSGRNQVQVHKVNDRK